VQFQNIIKANSDEPINKDESQSAEESSVVDANTQSNPSISPPTDPSQSVKDQPVENLEEETL
jgi:hypothetical protein